MENIKEKSIEGNVSQSSVETETKKKPKNPKKVGTVAKTYSTKVVNLHGAATIDLIKNECAIYARGYNIFSKKLLELFDMKIGDLYNLLPEKLRGNVYAQALIDDKNKDKHVFKMLCKGYDTNLANSAFFNVIRAMDDVELPKSKMGIPDSYFITEGYVSNVLSNYRTKFTQFGKLNIKFEKVTGETDEDTIKNQCVRECIIWEISKPCDFKKHVENMRGKDDMTDEQIKRLEILCDYHKNHTQEVVETRDTMLATHIKELGGCVRKYSDSYCTMKIRWADSLNKGKLFNIIQNGKYMYNIGFSKLFSADVFARKDLIKGNNILVDLSDKNIYTEHVVFKVQNNEMFINVQCNVPYNSKIEVVENFENIKRVGIDLNTKHNVFVFDSDFNITYPNVYKECLKNAEFNSLLEKLEQEGKDNIDYYKEMSKYVCFCPIEQQWLRKRGTNTTEGKIEKIFSDVLDRMCREANPIDSQYLCCVRKVRQQLLAKYKIKCAYDELLGEYVFEHGNEYCKEHPFSGTICGQELLAKMNKINKKVESCMKNIMYYVYTICRKNGYGHIALENIDKSTISNDRKFKIPSVKSLLGSYGFFGLSEEEVIAHKKYYLIAKGFFELEYNVDGFVCGAKMTEKGKIVKDNNDFHNVVMTTLHFASIKNYFVTLQNNGDVSVGFVMPGFTSMMNSDTHTLYVDKDKNVIRKSELRPSQEYHKNGKLCDVNAANNILHFTSANWAKMFLNKCDKPSYDTPIYKPACGRKEFVEKMIKKGYYSVL